MTWHYRIVRYKDGGGYGLHEVYCDAEGKERSMSEKPVGFVGDSPDGVVESLRMALADAEKRPVFDEPDWASFDAK